MSDKNNAPVLDFSSDGVASRPIEASKECIFWKWPQFVMHFIRSETKASNRETLFNVGA